MSSSTSPPVSSPSELADHAASLPQRGERFVERHERGITVFTRFGWLAKGTVYVLFGVTAVSIAQQSSPNPENEASPQGALGQVMDAPAGRLALGVMAFGLLLYAIWRAASVVLVDGSDAKDWGDRVGYTFSAVFYTLLAFTAGTSALSGTEPGESNSVERVSRSLLESSAGRWALGIGGVVTIAVGLYFAIRKGAMRSFTDDVAGVTKNAGPNTGIDHLIWIAGIVGWVGRGAVTGLVGFFVVRSAVNFDPDDARGFDRALREATTSTVGSALVWISAVGLIAYGAFCLLSHRRRTLGGALHVG